MTSEENTKKALYPFFKRLFDILFGLIGTILLVPIVLIVKIVYICHGDLKPVVFLQERVGKNGKNFGMFKIRTMTPNAEKALEKILSQDKELKKEYDINHKLKNDPRTLKYGSWIRRLSIDETPQFINILFGDMSLIGNRPYLPREIRTVDKNKMEQILSTKPGLVSYWAINGRNGVGFEKRLEFEAYYSIHENLALDTKILFLAVPVVLKRKGAS